MNWKWLSKSLSIYWVSCQCWSSRRSKAPFWFKKLFLWGRHRLISDGQGSRTAPVRVAIAGYVVIVCWRGCLSGQFKCPAKSLLFPSIKISTWEVRLWALGSIACIKEKVKLACHGLMGITWVLSKWGVPLLTALPPPAGMMPPPPMGMMPPPPPPPSGQPPPPPSGPLPPWQQQQQQPPPPPPPSSSMASSTPLPWQQSEWGRLGFGCGWDEGGAESTGASADALK